MRKKILTALCLIGLCSLKAFAKTHPTIWKLNTKEKVVALTFDDGPKPEESIALLNLLDQYGIRATFFITGRESEANPDLLKRINDSEHDIGNHSFSHRNLTTLSDQDVENELKKTNDIVYKITGKTIRFFRPPGGKINNKVSKIVAKTNLQTILYNVNTVDYTGGEKQSPSVQTLLASIKPGSILLLHNGGPQTLKNLPALLEGLKEKNYRCVRLSEFLNDSH